MNIQIQNATPREVEGLRALYRAEANCQIIKDSFVDRGLADPYIILVGGRIGGYGAISNTHDPGRLIEFYSVPRLHGVALPMFKELIAFSGATSIAAQTNMPLMLLMLLDCARNIACENVLFADAITTNLPSPASSDAILKKTVPGDAKRIFTHHREPVGKWMVEVGGAAVATAGAAYHYNPPYADIYMEVHEPFRRQGYGSYIVQEMKRICYESGKIPAARCDADNIASRMCLQKAGLLPCGQLLVGEINRSDITA